MIGNVQLKPPREGYMLEKKQIHMQEGDPGSAENYGQIEPPDRVGLDMVEETK